MKNLKLKDQEAISHQYGPCAGTSTGTYYLCNANLISSRHLKTISFGRTDQAEMLCVTDWGNRTLSFHLPNGKQV
jgi:hypothetical protein